MEHLSHFGLSPAALKAAILADLEGEADGEVDARALAAAVASAIDANNEEILRRLREILAAEVALAFEIRSRA
jgi:hypothetical protein